MSTTSNYKSDYIYVINWSHEEDVFNDNIVIRLYGYDKNRQSVMVRIEDFTVFCYIELPSDINWLNYLAPLKNSIKEKFKSKPIRYELEFKKKLYNPDYQPSKNKDVKYEQILRPYLKVTFTTHSKMKDFMSQARFGLHVSGLGKVTVSIFNGDNSLNPSLRMICINNINPVGWIKLKDAFVVDKIDFETTKSLEYIVKTENVAKVPDQLVKKLPVIFPSVLSFDIETYSSKLISMPDPDTPADVVFQIGCTFRSVKGKVTKYILTLKECDEIEDVIVIKCKSERVLLTDFAGLITKLDPDIITGYNIYGFDYQYIIKRAELCKCLNEFMKQSSINNRVCEKGKIEWESSAFGIQEHTYVDADGRLVFDMMPYMKRSFKLPNYRLETVCDEFLKTNKDPLKYRDIFECYEKGDGKSLALCGKYCVQDSYVVYLLFDKLNVWYDIAESANTNQVPMFYLYAKGQQIKMYAQVFSYCHHNNIVMNVPRNLTSERYSGATVLNPVAGIYKNIIPFDFASLYPSIIMAYNIDYTTYITNDKLKDEDCDVMDWNEHANCEHDPNYKPLKKKKEMTEDDEKKYQERQEKRDSKKICKHFHHKFAKASSVGKGVIPTILETLLSARKQVRKILESVSKEHKLISLFLDGKLSEEYSEDLKDFPSTKKLIDENSITKLKQLQQDLDVQKSVLDKRQLAYKVNANSMYGALGAGKGYLPFVSGAMTVTYIGRTSIEKAVNYIKSNWEDALVVYGDTDSCFINFRRFEDHTPEKYNEIWKFAEQVVEQIRHIFPSPMKLEFEGKIYATYFILSKKRYIAQPCDINGVMDKKLYKKGVVLQRRDNCRFLKEIYEATLWKILNNAEKLKFEGLSTHQIMKHPVVQETLDMIITYINKLFSREYTAQDFVITKGLNRVDYIGKRKPAHASLADKLGKRGITVPVNTRLEYVLINVDKKDKLQEDIIEEIGYFKEHRDVLRIDYFYYLEHQVMKPLDEILKVAFKVDDIVKNNVSLRAHKQLINKNIREVFHPQFEIDGEIKKPSQTQAKQKKQVSKESKEGKNNGSIIQMFQNLKNVNKVSSEKSALYTDAGCNSHTGDEAWASVVNQNSQDMIEQHKDLLSDFEIREVSLPVGNRHIIVAKFSDVQTQQNNGGELLGFCAGLRIALKQEFKQILIDSDLIYKYWSVGKISSSAREKMDVIKLKYINEVIELRKKFEMNGGIITKICGGENKADLGYHKD